MAYNKTSKIPEQKEQNVAFTQLNKLYITDANYFKL